MSTMTVTHGFRTTPAFRPRARQRSAVAVASSVRLTRRGRLVLLAFFLGLVFSALMVFGGQSAATDEQGAPLETELVVVGDGDTLWGIASTVAEPGEVREMIHRIQELNALSSGSLRQGQQLAVPVS